MRAISLWQPFASLWVTGLKRCETRSWQTAHRGPIWVHAAKRVERRHSAEFTHYYTALGMPPIDTLPTGCLLGTVNLRRCYQMKFADMTGQSSQEIAFGNWAPGRYAWQANDFRPLDTPIPWRGMQGLFNIPDDIMERAVCTSDHEPLLPQPSRSV